MYIYKIGVKYLASTQEKKIKKRINQQMSPSAPKVQLEYPEEQHD